MFFQERRVKVSLFLQDRIQNQDGGFVYSMKGPLPCCVQKPIQITYFDSGEGGKPDDKENIIETSFHNALEEGPRKWDMDRVFNPKSRVKGLGRNLYASSSSNGKVRAKSASGGGSSSSAACSASAQTSSPSSEAKADEGKDEEPEEGKLCCLLPSLLLLASLCLSCHISHSNVN